MAKRDVDLVIRARDEASAAANSVTAALKALQGVQDKLVASSSKTDTSLSHLGVAIKELGASFSTLTGTEKLASGLDKSRSKLAEMAVQGQAAAVKVKELNQSFSASQGVVTKYAGELERAKTALAQLKITQGATTAEIKLAKQAITDANTALKGAQATQAGAATAVDKQASAYNRLKTELQTVAATFLTQRASVVAFNATLEQAAKAIGGTLATAVEKQRAAMSASEAAFKQNQAAVDSLAAHMKTLEQVSQSEVEQFTRLAEAANRSKAAWSLQTIALNEMNQALKSAGPGMAGLEATTAKFAAIQSTLAGQLQKVTAAELTAKSGQDALGAAVIKASGDLTKEQAVTARVGNELSVLGSKAQVAAAAQKNFGNSSRTSLDFTQRLTAQIRALASAYIGIFGAIRGFKAVLDATITLQQATTRLNVVFAEQGGKKEAQAQLERLRQTADRVGLTFGVVAQQFSIFASSTLGSNINIKQTEKIFNSVATAASVLGLSMEDVQGVFKALGQIASKGTLQMEELRGQLGDRMPAALQLMADGLGITVQELQKATKAGDISSDALIGFADKITDRYGKELPNAIQNTQQRINALSNSLFRALLQIGEGGFTEAFNTILKDMTASFKSAGAKEFFSNLGTGLGIAIKGFGLLVTHAKAVVAVLVAIGAVKFAPLLTAGLRSIAGGFTSVRIAALLAADAYKANVAGLGVMTTAARATGVAMTSLKAAIGATGLGIILLVAAEVITRWAMSTSKAAQAMDNYQSHVEKVREAIDKAGLSVDEFVKKGLQVKDVSILGARKDRDTGLAEVKTQLEDIDKVSRLIVASKGISPALDATKESLLGLIQQLKDGTITAAAFDERLKNISLTDIDDKPFVTLIDRVREWGSELDKKRGNLDGFEAALAAVTETGAKLGNALKSMLTGDPFTEERKKETTDFAESLGEVAGKATLLKQAFGSLSDGISPVDDAVKRQKALTESLIKSYTDAKTAGKTWTASMAGFTLLEADRSLKELTLHLQQFKNELLAASKLPTNIKLSVDDQKLEEGIKAAIDAYVNLGVSADETNAKISSLGDKGSVAVKTHALALIDDIEAHRGLIDAQKDAELAGNAMQANLGGQGEAFRRVIEATKGAAAAAKQYGEVAKDSTGKALTSIDAAGQAWTRVGNITRHATQEEADALKHSNDELKQHGQMVDNTGKVWTKVGGITTRSIGAAGAVTREMSGNVIRLSGNIQQIGTAATEATIKSEEAARLAREAITAIGPASAGAIQGVAALGTQAGQTAGDVMAVKDAATQVNATPVAPVVDTTAIGQVEALKAAILSIADVAPQVQAAFAGIVAPIQAAFNGLASAVAGLVGQLTAALARLTAAIAQAKAALAAANSANAAPSKNKEGGPGTHRALGGSVYGPGTSTSDSILTRLSNGEFVLSARAVRKWGTGFLHRLNALQNVRGFASGGQIGSPIGAGLLAGAGGGSNMRPIIIPWPGVGGIPVMADDTVVRKLVASARKQKAQSAGSAPWWVGNA